MWPLSCRWIPPAARAAVAGALLLLTAPATVGAQDPAPAPGDGQSPPAGEPERPRLAPAFGANLTFASAFLWRGFVLGDDPVLQPSVWVRIGPVTVTSWSNTYLPPAGTIRYSEHDLSLDYTRQAGPLTLSAGWTNYAYPRETTGRYTNEFYAAVGGGGYLHPRLQVYHDVNVGNGSYAMVSVSHVYEVGSQGIAVTPSASVGYNRHLWTSRSGFSDLTVLLAASLPTWIPHLSFQPFFGYSHGFDTAVFPRRVYGGVGLAVE